MTGAGRADRLHVAPATADEVSLFADWAAAEGWNPGLGDAAVFYAGSKVGPLFADDVSVADRLFAALCAAARPGPLFVDVPDPNAAGVALVTRQGFTPMFETARMYRGPVPAEPVDGIFGVTTFELG